MERKHTKSNGWLTPLQVAKHLAISRDTLYRWVRTGKIPAIRIGWTIRFDPAEIERFKAKLTIGKF